MDLAGGLVGDASRRERFGEVNDIDITHLHIDWVGDPKNPNFKKINESESSCWSLDLMGFGRESEGDWVRENIVFGDIESDYSACCAKKMKRLLILFLLATCALVSADDTAKICTSDFGKTKALPASVFDSVKFPVSVAELIMEWGPGYRSKLSGTGMIYWRCVDGRFASVGPVSDLKTILNDPKIDDGNAQVSFFDANLGWSPFPLSINLKEYKEAQQGGTGQPATRFQSKSEGSDKPKPEAEGRSR